MFRELDQRSDGGVTVTLEWDPDTDRVQVRCEDPFGADRSYTCYSLEPRDARFGFLHPSAIATLWEIRVLADNQPQTDGDPRGLADCHPAGPDPEDELGATRHDHCAGTRGGSDDPS